MAIDRNSIDIPELLPYQRAWIEDKSDVKVYEKSRGIGITWAESLDAVLDAADPINGLDWYYVGYEKEMTEGFIRHAEKWIDRFKQVIPAIKPTPEVLPNDDKDINIFRVRFPSGHHIATLTSEPRNLRSRHKCIAVIDEAAFHDNLQALLDAAYAITTWAGRIHIISTHFGVENPFNLLINDIRAGRKSFSLHRTTLDDALKAGLYKTICKDSGTIWSPEAERLWRVKQFDRYAFEESAEQELLCIPSKGGGVFLTAELIESRMVDGVPVIRGRGSTAFDEVLPALDHALRTRLVPHFQSAFGEDFGRSGDITVIWPLQIVEANVRRTPFIVELRDCPYEVQRLVLFYILDRLPHFISGAMDAGGNGDYLSEQACLKYGGTKDKDKPPGRILPINLSLQWYMENMPKYKAAFEDKRIELPRHPDILADHRLLRMEKGVARVPETRTRGTDAGQRHGDSAIAGALAYWASFQNNAQYAYQPVHARVSDRAREPYDEDSHSNARDWGFSRNPFGRNKGAF